MLWEPCKSTEAFLKGFEILSFPELVFNDCQAVWPKLCKSFLHRVELGRRALVLAVVLRPRSACLVGPGRPRPAPALRWPRCSRSWGRRRTPGRRWTRRWSSPGSWSSSPVCSPCLECSCSLWWCWRCDWDALVRRRGAVAGCSWSHPPCPLATMCLVLTLARIWRSRGRGNMGDQQKQGQRVEAATRGEAWTIVMGRTTTTTSSWRTAPCAVQSRRRRSQEEVVSLSLLLFTIWDTTMAPSHVSSLWVSPGTLPSEQGPKVAPWGCRDLPGTCNPTLDLAIFLPSLMVILLLVKGGLLKPTFPEYHTTQGRVPCYRVTLTGSGHDMT